MVKVGAKQALKVKLLEMLKNNAFLQGQQGKKFDPEMIKEKKDGGRKSNS